MARISANMLLATMIALAISGCSLRRSSPAKCCPKYVSPPNNIQFTEKQPGAGVSFFFGAVPSYDIVRQSLFEQLATGNVAKLELQETLLMAARNSELADLIEAERHAVGCQADDCRTVALDLILQGEALEQRNEAAGMAAELFLGLVQVSLQRELIEESRLHLQELAATIRAADAEGFATSDGKNQLEQGNIRVKASQAGLSTQEQKLMYQLNLLIGLDPEHPVVLQPVYELLPEHVEFSVREQADIAESNRPRIRAIETAMSCGSGIESTYELLGQFDSRLGIQLAPTSIKRLLLRRQLVDKLQQEAEPDVTAETRRSQVELILGAKKQEARIAALEAMLKIQSSIEKLAIINEEIARLNAHQQRLKAKKEIDAQNSYLELHQNWIELQQAKSDRVTTAIEHETAKMRLLQAQGLLVRQCGFNLVTTYGRLDGCTCE